MSKTMIKAEFIGPNLTGLGDEALDHYRPRALVAMKDIGKGLVATLKKVVGRKGAGRELASKPGEPPMTETRAYQKAFGRRVIKKKYKIELQIANRRWEPWGRWLEYGTKTMDPRPHVAPTMEAELPKINDRLREL